MPLGNSVERPRGQGEDTEAMLKPIVIRTRIDVTREADLPYVS